MSALGPSTDLAQMRPKARRHLSSNRAFADNFNFWTSSEPATRSSRFSSLLDSPKDRRYKSLISLWWACLDSNQEPDRYERLKAVISRTKARIIVEF